MTEIEKFERKSAEAEPSSLNRTHLTCSNSRAFVWDGTPFAWPLDSRDLNGTEERMEVHNLESWIKIWLKFKPKTSFCETLGILDDDRATMRQKLQEKQTQISFNSSEAFQPIVQLVTKSLREERTMSMRQTMREIISRNM